MKTMETYPQLMESLNDVRRHWRLDQPFAAATDPLTADVSLYLKDPWRVVELLAHILVNAVKATAAAALGILGLVMDLAAREGSRQGHAARLLLRQRGRLFTQCLKLEADRFDVRIDAFIQERTLHDIHLLAASIELPAFQDRHLVRELVDL